MNRDQIIYRLQQQLTQHGTPPDQTTFMKASEERREFFIAYAARHFSENSTDGERLQQLWHGMSIGIRFAGERIAKMLTG